MSEFVLVAKFLTKCVLNVEAIGRTFKPFWKSWREFKVRDVGNHIVLFVFNSKIDAQRVLMNVPWSFDKNLVLFSQLENNSAIRNINFTHSLFWIQLHGLPVKKLNVDIVETVGSIVSSHFKNDMIGGDFMRVRVRVDVSKPLCWGCRVVFEDGKEGWVAFRYEKLPNFYYWCGLVNHDDQDCDC